MTSLLQLPCHVMSSRFSPNRAVQLVGFGGNDGAVYVYPFAGFNRVARLDGNSSPITALAFDQQQRRLVAGDDSGSVRLYDVTTEQFIRSFGQGHKSTVTGTDYHRYGEFITTCSRDTVLRIWDTRKNACLQSYKGVQVPLCATQFCPSGRWVASGCADGVVRLYDLTAGKAIDEFRAHKGPITSIHFHPEQYYMAVGSSDGSISLWDLESFTKVFHSASLNTPVDVVQMFGKKLFAAADHVLRSYDLSNLSDHAAASITSPWSIIGDLAYSSMNDEALFVEFTGTTARMGRFPIVALPGTVSSPPLVPFTRIPVPRLVSLEPKGISGPAARFQGPLVGITSCDSYVQVDERKSTTSRESGSPSPSATSEREETLVKNLLKSSTAMSSVLHHRLTHIRILRALWVKDPHQAIVHLKKLCIDDTESGVLTDFLLALQNLRMKERITIDHLPDLIELLEYAFKSSHEILVVAALKTLKSMNNKFRAKLDDTRRFVSSFRNDVGGTLDSRMKPFLELHNKFESTASSVYTLTERKGIVGEEARETLRELPPVPRLPQRVLSEQTMSENVLLPSVSLGSQHYADVYGEIDLLRESVKEAVSEAKQSSVFCQKIQRDISAFVLSEEHSRNGDAFANVDVLLSSTTSIMERLSSFENYIIGKVREEMQNATQTKQVNMSISYPYESKENIVSLSEENIANRLKGLEKQQEELDGKFQALVSDSVYAQGVLRNEMKSCVSKVRAHIVSLQQEVELTAATVQQHISEKGKNSRIPECLQELLKTLAALQIALEEERQVREEERERSFALMECMMEKIKVLGERDNVLSAKLEEIHHECLKVVVESQSERDPPCATRPTETQSNIEHELGELARDLCSVAGSTQHLRMQHEEHQNALERNAAEIAALRWALDELSVNAVSTPKSNAWPVVRKSRGDLPIWLREDINAREPREPTHASLKVANMLGIQTNYLHRSRAFQTWLTWTRGRVQLNKDKTILSLFVKQRNQLADITQQVHKMRESKQEAEAGEPTERIATRELLMAMTHVQRTWPSVLNVLHLLRPWVRHVECELKGARQRDLPTQRTYIARSARAPPPL